MKKTFRVVTVLALTLASLQVMSVRASAVTVPVPANPFGAQFGPDANRFTVLDSLGAAYMRTGVTVEGWNGRCFDCSQAAQRGIQTVLRVKANGNNETASHFPASLSSYKSTVATIASTLDPAVIVVENEMDARLYWEGTVEEYEQLLTAACEAAHQYGVPCTGGGLSNTAVTSMVYQSYVDDGDMAKAKAYANKISLSSRDYSRITDPRNAAKVNQVADKAYAYLQTHITAGADLINFHWYRSEDAFGETVDFLTRETGLPAMNNEIGQYSASGTDTTALMNAVLDADLRFAIWMSIDMLHKRDNRDIVALHNPDSTLRMSGTAFATKTSSL